jgi:hypothetical protein
MNNYLKYLKYKQKYLDLKNLNLNGSLNINNYKDFDGGVGGIPPPEGIKFPGYNEGYKDGYFKRDPNPNPNYLYNNYEEGYKQGIRDLIEEKGIKELGI